MWVGAVQVVSERGVSCREHSQQFPFCSLSLSHCLWVSAAAGRPSDTVSYIYTVYIYFFFSLWGGQRTCTFNQDQLWRRITFANESSKRERVVAVIISCYDAVWSWLNQQVNVWVVVVQEGGEEIYQSIDFSLMTTNLVWKGKDRTTLGSRRAKNCNLMIEKVLHQITALLLLLYYCVWVHARPTRKVSPFQLSLSKRRRNKSLCVISSNQKRANDEVVAWGVKVMLMTAVVPVKLGFSFSRSNRVSARDHLFLDFILHLRTSLFVRAVERLSDWLYNWHLCLDVILTRRGKSS